MKAFTAEELPALFNEWMRRFTEEPDRFMAEFKSASLFLAETSAGKEPSYGQSCTEYLDHMRGDFAANARATEAAKGMLVDMALEAADQLRARFKKTAPKKPKKRPARKRSRK